MLPTDEPLSHLGPSLLLLLQLQLLLAPASAFFPNIWSLLAAPGSITHQDLTEEAALNVTLQLFLEQPPPGRPPLRLEDFLVSVPGSGHIPGGFPHSGGLILLEGPACPEKGPHVHIPSSPPDINNTQESWSYNQESPSLGMSRIAPPL